MKAIQYNVPIASGVSLKLAIFSDLHMDSPDADLVSLKRDLDYCVKTGRHIIFGGDIFDAILLKDQKRAVNHLMEKSDNQLNEKIKRVVEFLKPYREHILLIARGNHEESILKYSGVDVLEFVVQMLNAGQKHQIQLGNYANFIRFNFVDKNKHSRAKYDIFQHHGMGGNAPQTKGMLDFSRLAKGTMADLICIGHKHNAIADYSDPLMYIDDNGNVKLKNRQFIQTPSYLKSRHIDDHNINFGERFYTQQALPGFASVEITPYSEGNAYHLNSEVKIITNPHVKLGEVEQYKLKLQQKQR